MSLSRRDLLERFLGAGFIGLRSLATGIPISFLANPRLALALPREPLPRFLADPQFIILSTSGDGDPIGCNAPGTYDNAAINHPSDPSMMPVPMLIGTTQSTAALPWTTLPADLLARTSFFHHATYTVVHPDQQQVQTLNGYAANDDMFVSLLAAQLAPALGTLQAEPVCLGPRSTSEGILYQGRPQPIVSPSALAYLLKPPDGPLGMLASLRDRDLDRMHDFIKCNGTSAQGDFVDRYARSQTEVRAISENLLSLLDTIQDDSVNSQIAAAVALIRMNFSPVVSLHIPFGGDNHGNMGTEVAATPIGVAALGNLWSALSAQGLQDRVSFLSFNVFGRLLADSGERAHNGNHHMALMFGKAFQASLIGGLEEKAVDFGATSIDSQTGAAMPNDTGDIPFTGTLQAMAATFGAGVGMTSDFLAQNIGSNAIVKAALSSG